MPKWINALISAGLASALVSCASKLVAPSPIENDPASLESLRELSIETLRARSYGSELKLEQQLGDAKGGTDYSKTYGETGSGPYETYLASYHSDGLRIYARLDLPNTPPPKGGYPVIIFCHGWVGIEAAPNFHFSYTPASMYAELIDGYVDAGFVVLTPGYRGHGTVNGVPADGLEYMAAWDNETYLSPSFYAIDVLNLVEGLGSISNLVFETFGGQREREITVDLDRVFISGHSQGGDVVLTVLAVAGETSEVGVDIAAASISDGTFAPRLEQLDFYAAMQGSRRSFLSGDGSWTGTADGADGSNNPEFVFGFPPDWIETPEPAEWTWQAKRWPDVPVSSAIQDRSRELYAVLNSQVRDLRDLSYPGGDNGTSSLADRHDPQVLAAMESVGGFNRPKLLTEPLLLHYSDQDFYSPPDWNLKLCRKVNASGGNCTALLYENNSHLMRASEYEWFSPPGTKDSYRTILARDIRFFLGLNPTDIAYP